MVSLSMPGRVIRVSMIVAMTMRVRMSLMTVLCPQRPVVTTARQAQQQQTPGGNHRTQTLH